MSEPRILQPTIVTRLACHGPDSVSVPLLRFGTLEVTMSLTCVMPPAPEGIQVLPPAIGHPPIVDIATNTAAQELLGASEGFVIGVPDRAGMFLSLSDISGGIHALVLGLGGINTLSGERYSAELVDGTFYTVPKQRYIDGTNAGNRAAGQFVTSWMGLGDGVGEQLDGDPEFGGFDFAVWQRPRSFGSPPQSFEALRGGGPPLSFDNGAAMKGGVGGGHVTAGVGANLFQTTVAGSIDGFNPEGDRYQAKLFLVDPGWWLKITGEIIPNRAPTARELVDRGAHFFVVDDGHLPDLAAGVTLGLQVQTIDERAEAAGFPNEQTPLKIPRGQISVLSAAPTLHQSF